MPPRRALLDEQDLAALLGGRRRGADARHAAAHDDKVIALVGQLLAGRGHLDVEGLEVGACLGEGVLDGRLVAVAREGRAADGVHVERLRLHDALAQAVGHGVEDLRGLVEHGVGVDGVDVLLQRRDDLVGGGLGTHELYGLDGVLGNRDVDDKRGRTALAPALVGARGHARALGVGDGGHGRGRGDGGGSRDEGAAGKRCILHGESSLMTCPAHSGRHAQRWAVPGTLSVRQTATQRRIPVYRFCITRRSWLFAGRGTAFGNSLRVTGA